MTRSLAHEASIEVADPLGIEGIESALPRGSALASPCGSFCLQLIEPDRLVVDDTGERLQRVAFGACDVPAAVGVQAAAYIADFGMDSISLAGSLAAKLRATCTTTRSKSHAR